MHLALLLTWAICLFAAWIGTGSGALRLLRFEAFSWPLSGVIGVSLFVAFGGLLNLLNLVHTPALIAIVVLGDALLIFEIFSGHHRFSKFRSKLLEQSIATRILATFCGLVLILVAVRSLSFSKFNTFDDLPAYLTFPVKLFQSGSLPFDPFSERRVQTGLGANYFLQAFMLVGGDIRSLWFIDAGAGLMLFAGCIFHAGRRLGNSTFLSLTLAALAILVPLSHANLSMSVLPAAIFAAMFLVETTEQSLLMQRSLLLGLLAAAASLLKSTYLPAAILILPALHLLRVRKGMWLTTVSDAMLSVLALFVVALPWMWDMKRKEGTMLYPLLGKGYEISAYGAVPHLVHPGYYPVKQGLAMMLAFVAAAVVHWMAARRCRYAAQVSTLLLVCGLVALPLSISVAGASLIRYAGPYELPIVLLFLGSLMRVPFKAPARPKLLIPAFFFAAILVLVFERYALTHDHFEIYVRAERFVPVNVSGAILSADEIQRQQDRVLKLQNAIPPGQAVFADLMVTFPIDFQRNEFYVADFPGMSSLPPGMPTQGRPEALRTYLMGKSIRYIAYSGNLASLRESVIPMLNYPDRTWPYVQCLNSVDVDREIAALAQIYRVAYDDGDEKVIDLLQPQRDLVAARLSSPH